MYHDVLGWQQAAPWLALSLAVGYMLGSIPFGVILSRLRGLGDLTKKGSGNIGATNVLRSGDKLAAALTLLGDGAKGAAAVLLLAQWGPLPSMIAAVGAFLGHVFPVWLNFRGGKGVATFFGALLALHWPTGLAALAIWIVVAFAFRYSSLAALVSAAASPFVLAAFDQWGPVLAVAGLAVAIFLTHAQNIRRLIAGEESRISLGGR